MATKDKRSRVYLAAVILVAVVLSSASLLLASRQGPGVTTSTTEAWPSNCTTNSPNGFAQASGASLEWTVFVMPPGSAAQLCITWTTDSPGVNASSLPADVLNVTTTHTNGGGVAYAYHKVRDINMTLDPSSVHSSKVGDSMFSVTAVYSVTAAVNASGFYSFEYPNMCPNPIPFAVVDTSHVVTAADFPQGFFIFLGSCAVEGDLSAGTITGYGGMTTTTVAAPK